MTDYSKPWPRFWTRQNGCDYESFTILHRRLGYIRKCGKCFRGVIAHGNSLLRKHCLCCGGEVRKVSA